MLKMDNIELKSLTEENHTGGMENTVLDEKLSEYYSLDADKEKILLVGHDCRIGGSEILLKNLVKEFIKQDVEVVVLVKFDGPIMEEYEKYAPTFTFDSLVKFENYIKDLKKYGYECAILNTSLCGDLIPLLHKWDFYVMNLVHELLGVIEILDVYSYVKTIADESDCVVFPSSYVEEKFETLYKVRNQKLIQPQGLYNPYDKFNRNESRKKIEEKYNIPHGNHIILNVGTGELRKGFDLFVEASKKLKTDNYSFIWVGNVDDGMQEYIDESINDNLILTGFISDIDQVMSFYDACDVFMLTSREDPFPSVVLEAFNAKRPVVAFKDAGGFCDIVLNDETGYLVDFESVDGLIDKIKLICDDENLKEVLGNNAKKICNDYSFPGYAKLLKTHCFTGRKISSLQNQLNEVTENIGYLENDVYSKSNKINYLEKENLKLSKENEELLSLKNKQISKLKRKNKKLSKEKKEILSSSSWKVTGPLRKVKNDAKSALKVKNKVKSMVEPNGKSYTPSKNKKSSKKKKKIRKKKFSLVPTFPGSYKTYITNENIKRVNLFIDEIDKTIFKLKYLFPFILEYCDKYGYSLRIIYHSADFDIFKTFFDINEIPEYLSLLNLKEENYLDVGLKEKYICTSWKNAKCLMNTSNINSTIYYYLDDLGECDAVDFYRISSMCYENNVVILNDDSNKIKSLKNFSYRYDVAINKKISNENRILCCDFGDMVNEGIELLNYLFLNGILDFNVWSVFIGSKDNVSMIYSDLNNLISKNSEKLNIDLFLKFDLNEQCFELNNENVIRIIIEKIKDANFNVVDITDIEEVSSFDKFILSKVTESNNILQISEILRNIDEVN